MSQQHPTSGFWRWLAAIVLEAIVLAALVIVAPPGLRKLGLFAPTIGICAGIAFGLTARKLLTPYKRSMPLVAALIVGLVWTGASWRWYREFHAAAVNAAAQDDGKRALALTVMRGFAKDDDVWAQRYDEELGRLDPAFRHYLAHRVTPLGRWSYTAVWSFWTAELLLAMLGAALSIRWTARNRPPQTPATKELAAETPRS